MRLAVGVEQTGPRRVRVPLGGGHARMAQQLLHRSDVRSSLEKMRSERVPQGVRGNPPTRQEPVRVPIEHRTDITLRKVVTPLVEEQSVRGGRRRKSKTTSPEPLAYRFDGVVRKG